jgi:lipid II:glycine glycyltransferase (peptidoglycan interpeptide bridge formation enzyme)
MGFTIAYIAKGPVGREENRPGFEAWANLWPEIDTACRKRRSVFLKVEPDLWEGEAHATSPAGFQLSPHTIQPPRTIVLDLTGTEDQVLSRMKQKTRYNVRLSEKKGITLRIGVQNDFPMLYKMYAETSVRDGFVIRDEGYYRAVWERFMHANVPTFERSNLPTCEPLIAEVDTEPVAAIFVFYFARRAYYVYGMSRSAHREKMPTYLLQWEAMKRARAKGCTAYDLWGAPEVFDETDSLWGVYRFKEGLGGQVVRTLGAWDYAPSSLWYKIYSDVMPRVLNVMRSRGKARTRQNLGA